MSCPPTTDFDQVFREQVPGVWRALRGLGVREADLEDVCQDVMVVVHRKLPGFEGRSSLQTWIYGVALRVASDYRKRGFRRHETSPGNVPEQVQPPGQVQALQHGENSALLRRLLDTLGDDQREVFVLYELQQLPMREVAAAVGCPLQTAYSRHKAAQRSVVQTAAALGKEHRP